MGRVSKKTTRGAGSLAASLMLAPAVVAMRMPLLAAEAANADPWRVETTRAFTEKAAAMAEGMVAAQMSLMWSASRFWLEACTGVTPSLLSGAAHDRAVQAALKPSGRRVKSNYNRLKRRQ